MFYFFTFLKLAFFLVPLIYFGLLLTKLSTRIIRLELLLPLGVIGGLSSFVVLLNLFSYLFAPKIAAVVTYAVIILICVALTHVADLSNLLWNRKFFGFWLLITVVIFGLLFLSVGHVIFGGDIMIHYSIAKTYLQGNFPFETPWQPLLPLNYHYGFALLIASLEFFTNRSFEFIQYVLAWLMIASIAQIFFWSVVKKITPISIAFGIILTSVAVISCGQLFFMWPTLGITLPNITSLDTFITWASNLPNAHLSFETYGGTVLDIPTAVYFIHYTYGFVSFIWVIFLTAFLNFKRFSFSIAIIVLGLSSLAIIYEPFLLLAVCAITIVLGSKLILRSDYRNFIKSVIFGLLLVIIVLTQGGVLSSILFNKHNTEKSVSIFLNESDFPQGKDSVSNIIGYHKNQISSHVFKDKPEWLNVYWYQIGFYWMLFISSVMMLINFRNLEEGDRNISLLLFISGLTSIFLYHAVVPMHVPANGNRLMSTSYHLLGLMIVFSIIKNAQILSKTKKIIEVVALSVLLWVVIFTDLPLLARLFVHGTTINQLIPQIDNNSETLMWLESNTSASDRILILSSDAPFASLNTQILSRSGVKTPVFESKYRAYTLEASPRYVDMGYTLNPNLLREFGINLIYLEQSYFESLPDIRKNDILNSSNFRILYESKESNFENWIRILEVRRAYLSDAKEINGTFSELITLIPKNSKIYIDEWYNVAPWHTLRKSIIFALKDYQPILVWGPGVYLNVETFVVTRPPMKDEKYDYLVLYKDTNPTAICKCKPVKIWDGLGGNVYLWKI